jgi:hypothetical protein
METMRQINENLYVADMESACIMADEFDLVIDCTGHGPAHPKRIHVAPTGKGNHSWMPVDLDKIVDRAVRRIVLGEKVLIHCNSGVNRSATAAAAVLLATKKASTIDGALMRVKYKGNMPNSACVSGLRKWLKEQQQTRLF